MKKKKKKTSLLRLTWKLWRKGRKAIQLTRMDRMPEKKKEKLKTSVYKGLRKDMNKGLKSAGLPLIPPPGKHKGLQIKQTADQVRTISRSVRLIKKAFMTGYAG